MNILLFNNTPAQVHEFRNVARTLQAKGHGVMVLARDYECTLALLDAYDLEYKVFGRAKHAGYGKMLELIPYVGKAFSLARKFGPDIIVGGIIAAYTSVLLRKPCISFIDGENIMLEQLLFKPIVKAIYTPSSFRRDLGRKHIRYNGFKELAYLHTDHFQPDASICDLLGLNKGEKFVILRFNPFDAFHDVNARGFSYEDKLRLVRALEPYARVFISSERKLQPTLEKYAVGIPPHRMHDAEFYAEMLIADTVTMVSEAAVLGTPSIHCSNYAITTSLGNLIEMQERYGLVFNYGDPNQAIAKAVELIQQPDLKQQWQVKRQKLLTDKIDVLNFFVEVIEGYAKNFAKCTNMGASH